MHRLLLGTNVNTTIFYTLIADLKLEGDYILVFTNLHSHVKNNIEASTIMP